MTGDGKTVLENKAVFVENGKIKVRFNSNSGQSDPVYIVDTNNGVISNIYLETTSDATTKTGFNGTLVNINNGLITDVYVYGYTSNKDGSFAKANNGLIYKRIEFTELIYEVPYLFI